MERRVLVTRRIPQPGIDRLIAEGCEVQVNPKDRPLTRRELVSQVSGKTALLCLLTDLIDREVMDAGRDLGIIANYAVGFNNIDVRYAKERGIQVTNTPGVLTETTADLTWALLMAVARRIPQADAFTRAGRFEGWAPMLFLGADVFGKTLGIIGVGRIGSAVARRAGGFDMELLLYDRAEADTRELERDTGAKRVDLETLLSESDFVSVHVPLSGSTRHVVGSAELARMKRTAFLVNTSRGPVVDEKALVVALRERRIAGAGLDVYEDEPALAAGLAELDNVVLLPHIGSASIETRTEMGLVAAGNIIALFKGKTPPNLVRL